MKLRIIASALLIVVLAGISNYANANPWRGGYRGGWFPHARVFVPVPRVFIPPVPVPVVVGGGYYGAAYGPGYYGGYGRGYYGGGHYGHGYHGGHYGHGYYGHRR